jgi:hypothetical protein
MEIDKYVDDSWNFMSILVINVEWWTLSRVWLKKLTRYYVKIEWGNA